MNTFRICVLLILFAIVALGIVFCRVGQTRSAAAALTIESQRVEARQRLWLVQTAVARLRAPQRLHARMSWIDTELVSPAEFDSSDEIVLTYPRPRG